MRKEIALANTTRAMSYFAKLLANENIKVVVENTDTAWFNVKDRMLTLPNMKDGISDAILRLFIAHEVGHAINTPPKEALPILEKYGNICQLVEDIRIENLMKRDYPGLRKNAFIPGYHELFFDNNFFGDKAMEDRTFMDRLNLHMKLRGQIDVPFNASEQAIVDAAKDILSWNDGVAMMETLRQYKINNPEPKRDQKIDSSDKFDGPASDTNNQGPTTEGEEESQSFLKKLFGDMKVHEEEIANIFVPQKLPMLKITKYADILVLYKAHIYKDTKKESIEKYKKLATANINYLAQLFNMKKNAKGRDLTKFQNTGELDISRVHEYHFTDDLFVNKRIVAQTKNYGMVLFLDWSTSMVETMYHSVVQLLILTDFCKKVGIPFEVYTFTSKLFVSTSTTKGNFTKGEISPNDNLSINHILSSTMSGKNYVEMKNLLLNTATKITISGDTSLPYFHMSQTPIHNTAIYAIELVNEFKRRTKVDIVNIAFVSDGDADYTDWAHGYPTLLEYKHIYLHHQKYNFIDKVSPLSPNNRGNVQTKTFLRMLADCTGANVLGFFLTQGNNWRINDEDAFWNNGWCFGNAEGYTQFFVIKAEKDTQNVSLLKSKRILNRIIELIT